MQSSIRKKSKKEKKEEKYEKIRSKRKEERSKKRSKGIKIPLVQYKKTNNIAIEIFGEDLMTHQELKSLSYQIGMCYSNNKKTVFPVNFYLSNYIPLLDYLDKNYEKWTLNLKKDKFLPIQDKIIYLSSDAEETLEEIDPESIYVVGGLIDRNRHKGAVYNYCKNNNIRCVKLPIEKHVRLCSSSVLTCNQVFDILSCYFIVKNWRIALEENIPKRKIIEWLDV